MTEQATTKMHIKMEPEERQRRLGEVYGLLITLAQRKRSAEQQQWGEQDQPVSNSVSIAGG
jgi:hypothetical protein